MVVAVDIITIIFVNMASLAVPTIQNNSGLGIRFFGVDHCRKL
jgi:hypothetical protein